MHNTCVIDSATEHTCMQVAIPKFQEEGRPSELSVAFKVVMSLETPETVGYFSPSKNTEISLSGFSNWHIHNLPDIRVDSHMAILTPSERNDKQGFCTNTFKFWS